MDRGEVTPAWYSERATALTQDIDDHGDQSLRLTSSYTFLAPLRFYLHREAEQRARAARTRAHNRRSTVAIRLSPVAGPAAAGRSGIAAVLPKPPFACDVTLEQELEAFEQLKPRLSEVWNVLTASSDAPGTSVVVPSLTLDTEELTKLTGASYYEERLLLLLIRLRNPRAHVVYVTSQPVHPLILDYYLHLLAGVPASHARARLTMLCAYDASPRPLTQKILERPRLLQRIRYAMPDPRRRI